MVKSFIIIVFIFTYFLNASVYENNCVSCHKDLPVSIDKYFYRYLLKYSSEESVKTAMLDYLKAPKEENSIMPKAFIERFGVKESSKLSHEELENAINLYWETYKVFGKLK